MNALSEFENIEKIGHYYVIQYFHLRGLSLTNIKAELDSILGESSPSFTTLKYWMAEFKRGRTICQDDHRSGRPNEVTTTEMVKKINKMVLDDRRLKMRELADMVGIISKSAVHRILTENLDMRRLCAKWASRLLTMEQKQSREDFSIECLAIFHSNEVNFLRRFITMDRKWVQHFTPEMKEYTEKNSLVKFISGVQISFRRLTKVRVTSKF